MTRIGSLFTGYGGLDCAVRQVLGGSVAWHSDIEPASVRLLEHHHPDVPNLGDITAVDWADVEPVDVLTGGFPCQDLSMAGKRLGLRPGTRSGLWEHMAYAINQLRPSLVVIENVRGLLSVRAHGDVEPCPWCVGDGSAEPLRALGAVLGDLAGLGYDTEWVGLRAADVGAPHGRFRVFILAADASGVGWDEGRPESAGLVGGPDAALSGDGATADCEGHEQREPAFGGLRQPLLRDSGPHRPVPETSRPETTWGHYEPAIRRWEHTLRRVAPPPTEPGRTGQPRLSPRFCEWLMGLPDGHVTAVPGLSRNEQLKLLGNGVVPAQAAAALHHLLRSEVAA